MSLYSDPPDARPYSKDKPTLLVSWWITLFCTAIIMARLFGRYVRVEKLFKEDKIIAGALLPLILRAVCVHFVLQYGTNNVNLEHLNPTEGQLRRMALGSRLVMASRVFYAAVLWVIKYATLELFSRFAGATNKRSHALIITGMRWALSVTFAALVISDLAECQPFDHYWQVTPDPGGRCRQGFAQMLTMGVCSVLTDLVLIGFPIPIILSTSIATKRKVMLVMLFCLVLVTIVITLYRMNFIIKQHGRQVDRTMWASVEILAATAVGNTVALGSFLRDSGIKRTKFKSSNGYSGLSDSRTASQAIRVTRTFASHWEEEEDNMPALAEGIWARKSYASDSNSKSDDARKDSTQIVSRSQSRDSLITREQHLHEMPSPPPTAVMAGDGREIRRGHAVSIVGGRHHDE